MTYLQERTSDPLRRLALLPRALVDGARIKINNGQELNLAQKAVWNDRLQRGDLDCPDLTRQQQLALTKSGRGTLQGAGSDAAHHVRVAEVAYAVTTCSDDRRALFRYVYGMSAEESVYEDVEE